MKIAHIYNSKIRDIYDFTTLEDAKAFFPSNMTLVKAPEYVTVGWSYLNGEFYKPTQSGYEYDIKNGVFYNHTKYREILHERTTNDTLEAYRKLRQGDQTIDWQAWLNELDAYNLAIEKTKEQTTYPDSVEYPEYPVKPTPQ